MLILFLPAATKLGQGNKFTGVCLSTRGGGVCSKFSGGCLLQIFGGGGLLQIFGGGCLLQIFVGGVSAQNFWGVSEIFFSFFFNLFDPPQKNSSGMHPPPRPREGQCAAGTHPTGMHSGIKKC